MVADKWHGIMVWTKWYTDKQMVLYNMVADNIWYGQNSTDKTIPVQSSINLSIPNPLII